MRRLILFPAFLLLVGAAPIERIEQLRLGYQLADWARQAGDADAMLAAARVVASSGARAARITGNVLLPDDDEATTPAAALADEATRMAPGDARIATAAAAVRDSVARGFVDGPSGAGPLALERRLAPRAVLSWTAKARGGEMAIVSAVGDGDSDIDLKVSNGTGGAVCADRKRDYYPMCRWSVGRAGTYRIEVTNKGTVPSNVMVLSN
ncbi:MAG: hypothetical protein ABI240_00415 [Sphingomonas sp.]